MPKAVTVRIEEQAPWVFHSVHFYEPSGFALERESQFTRAKHHERDRGLLLELLSDGLHVGFRWEPEVGQPARHERKNAFTLVDGEYGRVIVNGRHAPDGGNWYSQETFNIAIGDDLPSDTFISREPNQVLDLREDLF